MMNIVRPKYLPVVNKFNLRARNKIVSRSILYQITTGTVNRFIIW